MPKVGTKHFSYNKKGKEEAMEYSKMTGKKMTMSKPQMKKKMGGKGK